MDAIRVPDQFWNNPSKQPTIEEWKEWKSAFTDYLDVLVTLKPEVKRSEDVQLKLLRSNLGREGGRLFDSLKLSQRNTLKEAICILDKHWESIKSEPKSAHSTIGFPEIKIGDQSPTDPNEETQWVNVPFGGQSKTSTLKPEGAMHAHAKFPNQTSPPMIDVVQAHGREIDDSAIPQVPQDDGPLPKNYYKKTRRAILGDQDRIWVTPGYGHFKPNYKYKDVVLGWMDQPKIMAVVRKKARILVIMGHALPREIDCLPMYDTFRKGCKDWLSNGSSTAKYVNINEDYKSGDVLLITRDDQFDVERVYTKLISGENSAFIGYPSQDVKDSVSQLLEKLYVDFVRTETDIPDQFVYVNNVVTSNAFIPTSYWIKRYVISWKAFNTEKFQLKNEELGIEQKDVADSVKALVKKYDALMGNLGPRDRQVYIKDEKTATALLNYSLLLKWQFSETGFVLPNIHHFPGTIPSTTKPTNVVARVHADLPGSFFPLGVYVKPGEAFRWTVLKNSDDTFSNQWIRINAHTDLIDCHSKWSRWPTISTELCMKKQGQCVSPHGGVLFLQLPQGIDITIRVENVYRCPWLDLRNPKSIESFEQEIKDYCNVPWMVICGDSMNSMLRTIDVYNSKASEVITAARHYDNAIKVMHNYRGSRWEEARSEMFVADIQTSTGSEHPGYPCVGNLDWSQRFTLWRDQPAFINVMGKNLQVNEATLKGGDQVINNVYQLLIEDVLLGLDPYQGDMDTEKWSSSDYTGPGLGYYRYLGKLFGYGLVGNAFMEARKHAPGDEWEKTQFWIKQLCVETGYNLVPLHQMWNFPISDETRNACKAFPCFFPDDEHTKKNHSTVDAVLKGLKSSCSRSNSRKVEFRGDINRGVNTVRPQNIFLEFH
ncbi:protein FAM115A [Clonorchis sinensis]|uniref:Protein FAM115A n=1 Tax=Clonorchis sinensis TaxID=79923 RepID=H2KUL3_CLOSI|nr:protein FAM115A [Clonorchis sinensis]